MRFRPFLWLTIVSLPTLLVLVGLGSWQLQRLQWKNDLIASFESRAAAAPIAVPASQMSALMMSNFAVWRLSAPSSMIRKCS